MSAVQPELTNEKDCWTTTGDDARLNAYSTKRLQAVWKAVEFSHSMLDLLLARPAQGRFREGLRDARLARLMEGQTFARYFSASFVVLETPTVLTSIR